MKNAVLRLTTAILLAGVLVFEQGGVGRAQGPESRDLGDTNPVWSPVGDLIAFVSTRDAKPEVYVLNVEGKTPRRLTMSPPGVGSAEPAWSPDGRRIAFTTGALGVSQISIMNADGSGLRLLASGRSNRRPAWSPDGREVGFISNKTGRDSVFVFSLDDGRQVNITSELRDVWKFTWSPDGRRLAFGASDFEIRMDPELIIRAESRISVADVDGRNQRTLITTTNRTDPVAALITFSDPAWSPDGRRIAFDFFQGHLNQIHVIDADGSGRVPLTSQGSNYGPAWSPDGHRIAFLSHREGLWQVFVMAADGSGQLRVSGSGEGGRPSWSPDGRRIVYASKRGELWQIFSVNADGTDEMQLTQGQ